MDQNTVDNNEFQRKIYQSANMVASSAKNFRFITQGIQSLLFPLYACDNIPFIQAGNYIFPHTIAEDTPSEHSHIFLKDYPYDDH